jgi:LuxR family maltose regulon positive regulatory protein
VAEHSFSWVLDGQAGTIDAVLQAFPEGASADHPDLALAHAASELNHGRLDQGIAQLALAESHVQSAPPAHRRRLAVAIASLRLAMARRSGQFTEVIEQVNLLDASISDESTVPIAMGSELRAVALLNLGIVETWSGRLIDAERHLSEGAALAQAIGRPYLEVGCRAHMGFPSSLVSVATARERGLRAVALAERHGLDDRPILAPAYGAVGGMAIWMGEFDEGERWLRRAWQVAEPDIDPAPVVLLRVSAGMLQAGRGQHRAALDEFAAAAHAQSRLTGVHALAPRIAGWLAAAQARLGMPDGARATLGEFSGPDRRGAIANARALISLVEGDPEAALDELRDVRDNAIPGAPGFTLVEAHLLAGTAHLRLGDHQAAAAAAEAALEAAEPDRLIFPFAMTGAAELLDTLPHHATAHGALLADIMDVLQGATPSSTDGLPPVDDLSASELRVLRYLPTNLTRPDIAHELYVSVNTVNTHIRNIYSKLGVRDRSTAVQHARELRLLSTGHSRA